MPSSAHFSHLYSKVLSAVEEHSIHVQVPRKILFWTRVLHITLGKFFLENEGVYWNAVFFAGPSSAKFEIPFMKFFLKNQKWPVGCIDGKFFRFIAVAKYNSIRLRTMTVTPSWPLKQRENFLIIYMVEEKANMFDRNVKKNVLILRTGKLQWYYWPLDTNKAPLLRLCVKAAT